jgi:hypothetical protein
MAGKRKSPGPIHSKAQQGYIFGVLAKKNPKAAVWGKRWAHQVGENGPHGKPSPSSRAAYAALPRRNGTRKRA